MQLRSRFAATFSAASAVHSLVRLSVGVRVRVRMRVNACLPGERLNKINAITFALRRNKSRIFLIFR